MPGFNFLKSNHSGSNPDSFNHWITEHDTCSIHKFDYQNFYFSSFSNKHNPTIFVLSTEIVDIYLDGFVLELNNDQLKSVLNTLFSNCELENLNSTAKKFRSNFNGDYAFFIYLKQTSSWFFFNSSLARLPIYYYISDDSVIVSRNLRFVLANVNKLELDKFSIANKLVFGYLIDQHTFFKGICILGHGGSLLIRQNLDNTFNTQVKQTTIDLTNEPTKLSRESFIDSLVEKHTQHFKKYLTKFDNDHYFLSCDLTGGIDSRINLGFIKNLNGNSQFHCSSIKGYYKEEEFARTIFNIIKPKGQFFNLVSDNEFNYSLKENNDILMRTDGLVALTSALVSYELIKLVSQFNTDKPIVRISGLGFSDFLRKGFTKTGTSKDLLSFLLSKYSPFLPIDYVCRLVKIDYNDYVEYLKTIIASWPEQKVDDQLMKLFFIYQTNFCSTVSEDNERDFANNLNPMWDYHLTLKVIKELPLKWRSNYTAALFLKKINPDLLKGELNHQSITLHDLSSLRKKELINNYWYHFKNTNKAYIGSKELIKSFLRPENNTPNKSNSQNWATKLDNIEFHNFDKLVADEIDYFGIFKRDLVMSTESYLQYVYELKQQNK